MSAVPAWLAGRRAYLNCFSALLHPLVVFPDKAVVKADLGLFSSPYRILEPAVASQIVPFALEADRGTPALLPGPPLHAGDTAGVVFADGLGPEHLHAGAVDVGQAGPADGAGRLSKVLLVAAAGGPVAVTEALGDDHGLLPAVTAAEPCGPVPNIFRRGQDSQFPKPLPGQVQLFPRVILRHCAPSPFCNRIYNLLL